MSAAPTRTVELSVRLEAPPEDVFAFLTEADRYVRWQGIRAELDPRPGGVYRVWMDEHTVASGEYIEVDPPSRVVFSWGWEGNDAVPPGSTLVEFSLAADAGVTLLSLRHSGLPDGEAAAMHDEGWRFFTGRLAIVLGGGDPGPMPPAPIASG
jgi:uncharacterized protein YndB with AHSA1/START domain